MKLELIVENIKCAGCINSIKNKLMKIEGVQDVLIDIEKETIDIYSTTELDNSSISLTLSKMGYPERGTNNGFLKAKSYLSCAIGKLNK